mmetsp:Transcript_11435/g.18950  ORF Transcript_11435/g.18950 Transcript_11435/m.18950 type:complete len:226 (-) Transcript_11435:777-1454(-)
MVDLDDDTLSCCGNLAVTASLSIVSTRSKRIRTGCPGIRVVTAEVRPSVLYTSHIFPPIDDSTDTTLSPTRMLFATTSDALSEIPVTVTKPSSVSSTLIPIGRDSDSSKDCTDSASTFSKVRRRNSKSITGEITLREEMADRTPSNVLLGQSLLPMVADVAASTSPARTPACHANPPRVTDETITPSNESATNFSTLFCKTCREPKESSSASSKISLPCNSPPND